MRLNIFVMTFFIWATSLFAGELPTDSYMPSNKITISGGIGTLSVKDQSISGLRYSGPISYFTFGWTDYDDKGGFNLELEIKNGTEIANGNISAEILLLSLNLEFLKMKKNLILFKKEVQLFYGPSTGTEVYFRLQNIALEGGSADEALSVLWTIPIGVKADLFYPVSPSFHFEFGGKLNILSIGLRYPSNREDDLDLKLLHAGNGFNGIVDITAVYRGIKKLRLSLTLSQQLSNTTAWEESVLLATNNLLFGLAYDF